MNESEHQPLSPGGRAITSKWVEQDCSSPQPRAPGGKTASGAPDDGLEAFAGLHARGLAQSFNSSVLPRLGEPRGCAEHQAWKESGW
jgi:hypothetical protein